jgi:hypothetical protein
MMPTSLTRLVIPVARVFFPVSCLLICLACATSGEKFQLASLPRQGQAHLYVYHAIDRGLYRSPNEIGHRAIISLDGEEVGTLQAPYRPWGEPSCRYLLLSVSHGDHRIQARSKTWFGLFTENPTEKTFTAESDRVYFVRLRRISTSVNVTFHGNPPGAGRDVHVGSLVWSSDFSQVTELRDDPPPGITQCEVINSSAE